MTKPKARKAQSKGSSQKSTAESSGPVMPPLVPQAHGGALRLGGTPGNRGGTGRPRSMVRDDVLESFDSKSRQFLDAVVSGEIVSKMRIPVMSAAKHLTCPNCGGKEGALVATDPERVEFVEIEVETSATIAQRLKVAELQATFGLGAVKEVTVDNVRQRVNRTLDVLQARLSAEQFIAVCKELEPIWA